MDELTDWVRKENRSSNRLLAGLLVLGLGTGYCSRMKGMEDVMTESIFKIKPPLPMDDSPESGYKRMDYLKERMEFFKDNQDIRQGLEATLTKELQKARYYKQPERTRPYLIWFTTYLGWRK